MANRVKSLFCFFKADRDAMVQRPATSATWLCAGLIVGVVALLFVSRIADQPIRGEESRWAQGGAEMLRTGDWIVPRQQGQVFAERPPMNSWLIALGSLATGQTDSWSVRLPSVVAMLLTALVIFGYTRTWLSDAGGFVASTVFVSSGQVLQLGRLGESEAVLVACVTTSLLGWHYFWMTNRPGIAWAVGFFCAALAALTKGLQGPVYFVGVTTIYLLLQREFRFVLSAKYWLGLALMVVTIGLWMVPFANATDLQSVKDVWTGLVLDRVTLGGLLEHLVTYPLETLACLLPWSVFLLQLLNRQFRQSLSEYRTPIGFAVLAIAVTYPSVWLVAGARGRYFMPLYGMAAIPLGALVWQSMASVADSWGARGWWRYVRFVSAGSLVLAIVVGLSQSGLSVLEDARQTWSRAAVTLAGCLALGVALAILSLMYRRLNYFKHGLDPGTAKRFAMASYVLCLAAFGWIYNSFIVNQDLRYGNHLPTNIAALKEQLPPSVDLISLGPIHHRFEYHWQAPIAQSQWPETLNEEVAASDYFCFDYHVRDTAERRFSGRGRSWTTTPGTLPFEWEEVARIPLEREFQESQRWVVIGRPVRTSRGQLIAKGSRHSVPDRILR